MQALNEALSLVIAIVLLVFVVPALWGVVRQVTVNVVSVLLVCYILALFYTGTVSLADLHTGLAKTGPFLKESAQAVISAIKTAALAQDGSLVTRLCKAVAVML